MTEINTKKVIVVLGGHRSGTSAVTQGLASLGVDLGENMMPGVKDNNEKGFFEDVEINELNIDILNTLEVEWHSLLPIPSALLEQDKIAPFKLRAIKLLRAKMKGHIFGLKDPRVARLLPFWKGVFEHLNTIPSYIIAVRHPMSVAQSLFRRDGFDREKGEYLWLAHVLPSILETCSAKRVVVDFDELMSEPRAQLQRIASALDLPYEKSSPSINEFVNEFLDGELRHTYFEFADLRVDPSVPDDVTCAYGLLLRLARDEKDIDESEVGEVFNGLNRKYASLSPAFNYMIRSEKRIMEQEQKIATLDQHADNLTKVVTARDSEINELKQHATNLSRVVTAHESELADLNKHATNLSRVVTAYESELADLNKHTSSLSGILAERESQVDILKETIAVRDEKYGTFQSIKERAEFIEKQLHNAENRITEFLASKSWRITQPLRALGSGIRKRRQPEHSVAIAELTQAEVHVEDLGECNCPDELLHDMSGFDPEFYKNAYPDICGLEPYFHYATFGKHEGRLACAPDFKELDDANRKLDQTKATVLVVSHEASRTGAPILSWNIARQLKEKYNVIACLLRGGDMLPEFQEHCDMVISLEQLHNNYVFFRIVDRLARETDIKFAIVNSIVSSSVLPAIANHFIPSLCLIHEFASYTRPQHVIADAILWSSEVVFSAEIVHANAANHYEVLKRREAVIFPQGKCVVPSSSQKTEETEKQIARKIFRPQSQEDRATVILGAGYVQLRKGVDLFLACAARVVGLCPQNNFRFVWVGQGFNPDTDTDYSAYLQDQITRSELENVVFFTGELSDIEMAYELSDVLLLSSRLDPLPNVAIDAMLKQLPVICFNGTTGIADLLKENGLGNECVIPYLDVELASQKLVELIDNPKQRQKLGQDVKILANQLFNMTSYVDSLEKLALAHLSRGLEEKSDCRIIEEEKILDQDYYVKSAGVCVSYKETVRLFVRTWTSGIDLRKPFAGFHPGIFLDAHGETLTKRNPLVGFIEAGKPEGPWLIDLIRPSQISKSKKEKTLRTALHIHVFFMDLFLDIFQRLEDQDLQLDLLISVPDFEIAQEIERVLSSYRNGTVEIRTVPNRGRDIGPLLTEFNDIILESYDVIGHVHTKKSGDVNDKSMGKNWFSFLMENLIGDKYPMASVILERFSSNPELGLVFPDDPYVVGWSANKEIAEELANKLDIADLPERHFNFPVGTMFWARTEAIRPLLMSGFDWDEYPDEPLPYDGTVLHAIERLLPFVANKMDYQCMSTHVPGITR